MADLIEQGAVPLFDSASSNTESKLRMNERMDQALLNNPPMYTQNLTELISEIVDNNGILFAFVVQKNLKFFSDPTWS